MIEYTVNQHPHITYTSEQMEIANKTSRGRGSVGANAIVPKHVRLVSSKIDSILDFGAGKDAMHANKLRNEGYDVTAYEFGDNVNNNHDQNALSRKYDIVYASNVLNVQQSEDMMHNTINLLYQVCGGIVIVNYPSSPVSQTSPRRSWKQCCVILLPVLNVLEVQNKLHCTN